MKMSENIGAISLILLASALLIGVLMLSHEVYSARIEAAPIGQWR